MTSTERQLPLLAAGDGAEDIEAFKEAFGIREQPIDTALRRLHAWSLAALGAPGALGCVNMIRVDDVLYTWDAHPRRLQNGALQGRVYAKRRGQLDQDIGGFKIDARGRVVQLPAPLREVLPVGLEAAAGAEEAQP